MTMVTIPFPLSSSPGASSQESAGRIINGYAEPLGQDVNASKGFAPPKVVWRKNPGLTKFGASSFTGNRGLQLVGNSLYAAWGSHASFFDSTGAETTLTGTL